MGTPEELVEHLKHMEGWVAHPYRCAAGYPTIGYGHRIPSMNHPDLTLEEGFALLGADIAKATLAAVRMSPGLVHAAPRRLNAVIDFLFNCGGAAYGMSKLRDKVNAEDWDAAALENAKWVHITDPKTRLKHISAWQIKRRAITSAWLRTG